MCYLAALPCGSILPSLAGVTTAPFIRDGRLLPVLVDQMTDLGNYRVYFGSGTAQPVRACIKAASSPLALDTLHGEIDGLALALHLPLDTCMQP